MQPLLDLEEWFQNESVLVTFPRHVAVEKELRDAAMEACIITEKAVVDMSMRVDLFQKLVAYRTEAAEKDALSPERMRALDKLIRDGKRNGLNLDEATREEIKAIKNQLNEKGLEFSKNLAEDKWTHWFSEEELKGLPKTFLEGLEKNEEEKFKVTLQYPHLFPVTKLCKVPETRRIMETANASKAMEPNTKLLEDMVELRHKEATLLGYKNHASYIQVGLFFLWAENNFTKLKLLS